MFTCVSERERENLSTSTYYEILPRGRAKLDKERERKRERQVDGSEVERGFDFKFTCHNTGKQMIIYSLPFTVSCTRASPQL